MAATVFGLSLTFGVPMLPYHSLRAISEDGCSLTIEATHLFVTDIVRRRRPLLEPAWRFRRDEKVVSRSAHDCIAGPIELVNPLSTAYPGPLAR
jgi:hypothetical protein